MAQVQSAHKYSMHEKSFVKQFASNVKCFRVCSARWTASQQEVYDELHKFVSYSQKSKKEYERRV